MKGNYTFQQQIERSSYGEEQKTETYRLFNRSDSVTFSVSDD